MINAPAIQMNMTGTINKDEIKREHADLFARQTVGYLVRRTVALVSKKLNEELGKEEITLNHWVILSCLWQKDGLPVMYIGNQLQHIGGTMSDLLTRMEKRKLIKRKRDKKDRRIWRVYLTEQGNQLCEVLPPVVHRIWYQAWQGLSEEDLKRFSCVLDHMIKNCEPDYSVCLPGECSQVSDKYRFILPPRSIGYRLKLLQLLITRRYTDAVEIYNVTSAHTLVLCRLWQEDGVPVSEIGQYLEQVGGSLTGVLERMEERGLIRREKDEKDKRCFRVWLTDEGEGLIAVLPPITRSVLAAICDGLEPDDVDFFKQCLNKMLVSACEKKSQN